MVLLINTVISTEVDAMVEAGYGSQWMTVEVLMLVLG